MRAFVGLIAIVLAVPRFVHADVGVVVSGDQAINAATETAVSSWLSKRNFQLAPSPLPADGVTSLSGCLVVVEMKCAREVVEARSKAASVVAIITEASGAKARRTIQLSAYWISKSHDVVSVQRTCGSCTDDQLLKTIDELMGDLGRIAPAMNGRVKITSSPPGMLALVDGSAIGITPIEHDVTPGPHEVTLTHDNQVLASRHVDIAPDQMAELDVPVPSQVVRHSRAVPATTIAVGVVALAAGAVMYDKGGPTGDNFYYRNYRTPGIGVAAGGAAVAVIGVIWFLHSSGGSATPTIALAPGGVAVGWTRSF